MVLITECGRDRVRDGDPHINDGYIPLGSGPYGWRDQGITEDEYIDELRSFDDQLEKVPNVFGCVFTTSPSEDWNSYGISNPLVDFKRLGPHDIRGNDSKALEWARGATIVKSVGSTAAIRVANPMAITIYRWPFSGTQQTDILQGNKVDVLTSTILAGLGGYRRQQLFVELLNEIPFGLRAQYVRLARAAVPILHNAGVLVAGPSWASGEYSQSDWDAFSAGEKVLYGVDVSNHQGTVNWPLVKADGFGFAICKASGDETDSNVFLDPTFAANWAALRSQGMQRGAYHYARPSRVSPAESVGTLEKALRAAGGLAVGDHVALDMEDPDVPVGVALDTWSAEWCDLAEKVFGVAPEFYSNVAYMGEHNIRGQLANSRLWLASWQVTKPAIPVGWQTILVWQKSSSGYVRGIGNVDLNDFNGMVEDWIALGAKKAWPDQPDVTVPGPTTKEQIQSIISSLQSIADGLP